MKHTVSKRFSFEAAHSLPHLPVWHKCSNLHGHSYVVEVFITGPLDERGFVVDYAEISAAMGAEIARLDHQNLNEILPFPTTAELIAGYFLQLMEVKFPAMKIAIQLYETAKTCVRVER